MKRKILLCIILSAVIVGVFIAVNQKQSIAEPKLPAKSKITDCTFNGINLYGKVQVVDAFPDIKVQVVDAFPDLKVQVVDAFPDFKIQFVDAFPDIKIQYVDAFPGLP